MSDKRTHRTKRRNTYVITACGDEVALWNGAILPPHLFYRDDIRGETSVSMPLAAIIIRLITRPVDTAIKTRYDRKYYIRIRERRPLRSKLDSEFLSGSFDTPYRRRVNNYRTKDERERERSVWSDTTSSPGLTRTETRFVIVSRRGWTLIVLPRAPVAMRFQRGRR